MVKPSKKLIRLAAEKIISDQVEEGARENRAVIKGSKINNESFFAKKQALNLRPEILESSESNNAKSNAFISDGFSQILSTLSAIGKSLNKSAKLDKKEDETERRKDNKFRKRAREAELEKESKDKERKKVDLRAVNVGKGIFTSIGSFFSKILVGSTLLSLVRFVESGKLKNLAGFTALIGLGGLASAFGGPAVIGALGIEGLRAVRGATKIFRGGASVLKARGKNLGPPIRETGVKGFRGIALRTRDKFLSARKNIQRRGLRTLNPLDDDFLFASGSKRDQIRSAKVNRNFADLDRPNMRTLGRSSKPKFVKGFSKLKLKEDRALALREALPGPKPGTGALRPKNRLDFKKFLGKDDLTGKVKGIRRIATTSIISPGGGGGLTPELPVGTPPRVPPKSGIGKFFGNLGKRAKNILKIGGKGGTKSFFKKIPILGLGLGTLFAAQRAMAGDFVGAGMELASGVAGSFPGLGTGASIAIDAALIAKDMGTFDSQAKGDLAQSISQTPRRRRPIVNVVPVAPEVPPETTSTAGANQTPFENSASTSAIEPNFTSSLYGIIGRMA